MTASGGLATITESTFASETDLYLNFTVPSGTQSLQFTLNSVFADSTLANNNANGYLPDAFGASLLNPEYAGLARANGRSDNRLFLHKGHSGGAFTRELAANGVTVSSSPGSLWR